MYIPRLRRISDVLEEIKSKDPKNQIRWRTIKRLIQEGKITALKYGNSWLINLDELYAFFEGRLNK